MLRLLFIILLQEHCNNYVEDTAYTDGNTISFDINNVFLEILFQQVCKQRENKAVTAREKSI